MTLMTLLMTLFMTLYFPFLKGLTLMTETLAYMCTRARTYVHVFMRHMCHKCHK